MNLYEIGALPEGLVMSLAMDLTAMTNFVHLDDSKKEELVTYIQGATTGEDAKNRVAEVLNQLR